MDCVWFVNTNRCKVVGCNRSKSTSISSLWNLLIKPQNITNMLIVRRGKHECIYRAMFPQLPIHNALAKPPPHTPKPQEPLSNTKPETESQIRLPPKPLWWTLQRTFEQRFGFRKCIMTIFSPHYYDSKNTNRNTSKKTLETPSPTGSHTIPHRSAINDHHPRNDL